jgi:hypothetical protein
MKLAQRCMLTLWLCASSIAMAEIQQHNFSIFGDNGETGAGNFTWDDAVVTGGSRLADYDLPSELLSVSITLAGGNVIGGSASFDRADCTEAILEFTPDFVTDINFWCDNGTNSLIGVFEYTIDLNNGGSVLTLTPGTTLAASPPTPVPTMSAYGLALTMLGLLIIVAPQLRVSAKRR